MKQKLAKSFDTIKKSGLSSTISRVVVFDILSCDEHFHAITDIIKMAREKHDIKLNTKSVYNAIDDFDKKGLISHAVLGHNVGYSLKHKEGKIHIIDGGKISHAKMSEGSLADIRKKIGKKKQIVEINVVIK